MDLFRNLLQIDSARALLELQETRLFKRTRRYLEKQTASVLMEKSAYLSKVQRQLDLDAIQIQLSL